MTIVRVGVIGAGIMGADHACTLQRAVAGAEVTMVADVDPVRARTVVTAIDGSKATDNGFALITDDAVDAVLIASHDSTHAAFATAAIRAGKPVMCEKPLAPTVTECEQVLSEAASVIGPDGAPALCVGFMRRFDPGYVDVKRALAEGAIGAPLVVHCISRGVSSAPGATSESSITGSAIHEFDVVPWLLGSPIVEVSWHAARRSGSVAQALRDPQVILLRTADGTLTTVEVFLNARYGYDVRCEIVGEEGTLALAEPVRVVVDRNRGRTTEYPADWRPRFADAYRLELQAWIDAVAAGVTPPLATGRDGLAAAVVAEAVIASMRQGGRTVQISSPGLGG